MPRPYRLSIEAGVMLLPVLYVLSEAPLVWLTVDVPHGGWWRVYEPVDWLSDNTPLEKPLLRWADACGVKPEFLDASDIRWAERGY